MPSIHAADKSRWRTSNAIPGAALLTAGVILLFLTLLVPIGHDVSVIWTDINIANVRAVVLEVPRGADGRPILRFTSMDVSGATNGSVPTFDRTPDGFIERVRLTNLNAGAGSEITFHGRTVNRVPDGPYLWNATATDASSVGHSAGTTISIQTSIIESISWFFIENPAYLAIPFVLGALLLSSIFGCPDECTPEGSKIGCTSELFMETYPCGDSPADIKGVRTGAQIMAWAASRAKKLPVLGATYAAFLESMPGWVDVGKSLTEKRVGTEVYVTVVCRWKACRTRSCWVFWKQRKWVDEGTAYGPFKLKPPTGYFTANADCFGPGLEPERMYAGIQEAINANTDISDAQAKCLAECGK